MGYPPGYRRKVSVLVVACSDLWSAAKARVGLNFADGRLDDNNMAGVLAAINAGLAELALDHDWDWLYAETTHTTAAGTETYSVPTNYLRTQWLAIEDTPLVAQSRRDAVRYYGQTAYPAFYSVSNGLIRLSPIPNGVYTVRHGYFTSFAKVSESTVSALSGVTLAIPVPFEGLAALYIAKQICLSFKDQAGYNLVIEEIRAEKQRLDDNVRRSLGPQAPSVRKDW